MLAGGQNLRRRLGDFVFQLIKFLLHYVFIVREVGFQPFEGPGIILGFEVTLKLVELLITHLIGQSNTYPHFQSFIDVSQKAVLFILRKPS